MKGITTITVQTVQMSVMRKIRKTRATRKTRRIKRVRQTKDIKLSPSYDKRAAGPLFFSDGEAGKAFNAVFPFAFVLILLYNNISYTLVHGVHKTGEEKVKEFLNTVKDFCGDNYIWMLVGAIALLVLIIAAVTGAAARHTRRKSISGSCGDERDYFMEGEYDLLLKSQAEARHGATANQVENGGQDESNAEAECNDADEEGQDTLINSQEVQKEDNQCCDNGYEPEKELEALTDQPVCININIEHGRIEIGYGPDVELTCAGDEGDAASDDAESHVPDEDEPEKYIPEDGILETEEAREEGSRQEIILEKINLIKGAPVKKFGPGNLNTGRSGRIYTEEELRRLIKE